MVEPGAYHVIRREGDSWQVIKEGFKRPHFVGRTKQEAILLAKRLAKLTPEARVIVHHETDLLAVRGEYDSKAA